MLHILLSLMYWQLNKKNGENPLAILYYHHVFKHKNNFHPDDICLKDFDAQVKFLAKHFIILDLPTAIKLLKNKQLPPKALVITFDDGYLDNYTCAAPILKKYNCSATFFISTDGIDKGVLWNDQIEQLLQNTSASEISSNIIGEKLSITTVDEKISAFNNLLSKLKFLSHKDRSDKIALLTEELGEVHFKRTMMTKEQIKELSQQGFTIGAHTHNHTILTTESIEDNRKELMKNIAKLEALTNKTVDYIAYPNGLYGRDYNIEHCKLSQELNLCSGFSTNDGGAISSTNPYTIPRFMPYRKQLHLFALSIAKIAGEHV